MSFKNDYESNITDLEEELRLESSLREITRVRFKVCVEEEGPVVRVEMDFPSKNLLALSGF